MAKPLIRKRDRRAARAEAKVRFGPERSTLNMLLGDVKGQYKADVRAANQAAKYSVQGVKRARKPLRGIYNQALSRADAARQDVDTAFEDIGPAADPFEAATVRESALNRQQIADAAARGQQELTTRAQDARLGRQFAVGAAAGKYRTDLQQLGQRLLDLGDRQGAYVAARLGDLANVRLDQGFKAREAAKTRKADRDEIKLRAGLDAKTDGQGVYSEGAFKGYRKSEVNAMPKAERLGIAKAYDADSGGGGTVAGSKPATRAELRGFKGKYSKALVYAKRGASSGTPRKAAKAQLTTGVPASKERLGVPTISDPLALGVALDMAYFRHVTPQNERRLHAAGIRVDDIPGAVSFKRWQRDRRRYDRTAPGPAGQGSRPG